jgi:EmrB/QacA subfamily drug resistance transporter
MSTAVAGGGSRVRPSGVLLTCCVAVFLIGLNTTAVNSAITQIADDLSIGATTLAFSVNAYVIATAIIVMPAGKAVDVIGVANVFLIGLGLFALGSLSLALAPDAVLVIAGRMLQGAGSAFLMPASMSALGIAFPPERRGSALGVWGAVVGIAFAVGPLYGGAWTDAVSWRGIYWSDFVIIGIGAALVLVMLRPLPRPPAAKIDFLGAVLLGVALLALVIAAQYGQSWGWGSPLTLSLVALGGLLLVAFVEWDAHRPPDRRLVDLSLFRLRAYTGGIILTGVSTIGLLGILYFWNLYSQSPVTLELSAVEASLMLVPFGIGLFLTSFFGGRLADAVGYRIPVTIGFLATGIGFLWLADIGTATSAGELIAPLVICGLGVGLTFSNPGSAGLSVVPPEQVGEAAGAINVSRYLLAAFGLAISSAVYLAVSAGDFRDRLEADGIAAPEEDTLDQAITGTGQGLQQAIDAVGPGSRASVTAAAEVSIVNGFRGAMALTAAVTLIGVVLSVLTLPGRRRA